MQRTKVPFNKKKDFEYSPISIVDITRIELVDRVRKKKSLGVVLPTGDFGFVDNGANQLTTDSFSIPVGLIPTPTPLVSLLGTSA